MNELLITNATTLHKLLRDNIEQSRVISENTVVHVSLAALYDLVYDAIHYTEQKGEQEMELIKQRVKAVLI